MVIFFFNFENTKASALEFVTVQTLVRTKKLLFIYFWNFFWNKTGFFRAALFLNVNVLHKGLLLQD